MRKNLMLFLCLFIGITQLWAQTKEVSGKVTDSKDGNPLAGVTISVRGKAIGVSDKDGNFRVTVPSDSKTLTFSFVGFKEQSVSITNTTSVSISLDSDSGSLSEVVVTGYKTLNKREFGGAATTIKGDNIRNIPIASFDQLLQGQAPGLVSRATSGQPGASGSIQIRGRGTLTQGATEPLYVVDGIRISAVDFALLNPNDIETFNILKDAASAGLYGSEGGNGVIVITTRRGRPGKPKMEFEAFTGWSTFPELRDYRLMNTEEKIAYEQRRNSLLPPAFRSAIASYSPALIDSLKRINTNWEDEVTRTGKTYNLSGAVSGGAEKFRYFSSVNYYKQEGTVRNTEFERVTARLNLNQDAGNFSFGLNTTGTYSKFSNTGEQNTSIATPLNGLQWANPYEQPFVRGRYTPAGNFTFAGAGPNDITRQRVTQTAQPMPTTELFWNTNDANQLRVLVSGNAEYKVPFVKGLSARVVYGVDYRSYEDQRITDRRSYSGGFNPRPTSGSFSNFRTNSFARDFTYRQRVTNTWSLNYNKKFDDHTIDAGAFYETVDVSGSNSGNTTFSIITPFQNEAGATINADLLPRIRGGGFKQTLQSYFGTISYGYKGKYYLSGNFRRDGSSAFGANNRYANFWGVSASWIVSDESFFSGLKSVLPNLKYKISYGEVGNSFVLGSYASQGRVVANRLYNAVAGSVVTEIDNPNLQWEVRKKFNTGIEFSLLNNKLNAGIDYYNEVSESLLSQREISSTNGFERAPDNIGSVRNAGVEFMFNYNAISNKNFKLSFSGNFTYNKNTVLELAGGLDTVVTLVGGIPMVNIKGQPMNQLFLVEAAGVRSSDGEALYKKADGTITDAFSVDDRRAWGSTDPRFFGGFGFNADYKGFGITTQFVYMLGMNIYNNERNNLENPDYFYDNVNADLLTQEWQKPGDNARIPSPGSLYFAETTRFLEDNSFLRLRNVMVSYTLADKYAKAMKLSGLMVYVSGTNLFTSTKYRGRDPESAQQIATQGAQYPSLRTIQAGIRVNF